MWWCDQLHVHNLLKRIFHEFSIVDMASFWKPGGDLPTAGKSGIDKRESNQSKNGKEGRKSYSDEEIAFNKGRKSGGSEEITSPKDSQAPKLSNAVMSMKVNDIIL